MSASKVDDQPPPYEATPENKKDSKGNADEFRRWSFADEITISRSQHVAATAARVHSTLEARARFGISKATLLLVPSGQIDLSKSHKVVEFEDIKYTMVELDGEADSLEFWSQAPAIQELTSRVSESLNGDTGGRSGAFKVGARLKEYHFRMESAFGLMETAVAKCIVIELET